MISRHLIFSISIIGVFNLFFFFFGQILLHWIGYKWIFILCAVILAVMVGFLINYFYQKYSWSRLLKITLTPPNKAKHTGIKLILKENQEFIIKKFLHVSGLKNFLALL
jgi:hypothetical protein